MIIPVKYSVPHIQATYSYDFEVAVLDFRHMYRLKWISDDHLEELMSLFTKLDSNTLLEVFIDRMIYSNKVRTSLAFTSVSVQYYKDTGKGK